MTSLIIFDCDGTLVDTELLYNTVISDMLLEQGYREFTPAACLERFTGLTLSAIRRQVELEKSVDLSAIMTSELYVARAQAQMDQGIAAIAGADILIETALAQGFEICIGSNGERSSVIKSLKLAGLYDYFGGTESRIFTKIQVENAKPAPDLFLFAAAQMTALMGMGAAPPKTVIVIEDSVAGVQAGVAANMRVWGYTGSHHDPEAHKITLLENGAERCFSSLIHISDELQGKKEFCSA